MPESSGEVYIHSLGLKALALRDYALVRLEYHGPLTADGNQKLRILRWIASGQLKDEAVRRWGISAVEAEIVAEAAVSNVDGILRHIARLASVDEPEGSDVSSG